jgi:hypothetical protein
MEDVTTINQDVTIVAYYFKNKNQPKCFPKKMEYGGRTVTFTETGLRHPTHRGQRMIHVFDMTDGQADYRLEFDAESLRWRLAYIADQAQGGLPELAYAPAT